MKLTYRDKVILAVFLFIAITLVGFLWLIKPKTKKLQDNQVRLEELQQQQEEVRLKIDQIKPLQEKIKTIYSDTKKVSEVFVPISDVDTTVKLDQALQKYADENNCKVLKLEVSKSKVSGLNYYYYKDENDDAELRENADINGNLPDQYNEQHAEQVSLDDRQVEDMYQTLYGVKVNGTKEDIWNYLRAIKEYDKALLINSVKINDYSFGQDLLDEIEKTGQQIAQVVTTQEEAPAEGEEAPAEGEAEANEEEQKTPVISITLDGKEVTNTSDVEIVITAYSIYEMPEPDVDFVPSASSAE